MENAVALLAIALLANKLIELLKGIRVRDWNRVVTLLVLFVAGFGALSLAAHAAVTEHMIVPGTLTEIGFLDWPSLALLGLMITATGSTLYDFRKAFDNTDSAAQPKLLPPSSQTPPQQ